MKAKRRRRVPAPPPAGSVPLARIKLSFSRYIREVQTREQPITITQHGRPAAVLAPIAAAVQPALTIREPVDPRPLGALALRPPPREGARTEAIGRALEEERSE